MKLKGKSAKKTSLILILFLVALSPLAFNRPVYTQERSQHPFRVGEKLSYMIKIMGYHAGMADIEVVGIEELNGIQCYHITADTYALEFVRAGTGYCLHDRIEGWIDVETLLPIRQIKDLKEGDWEDYIVVDFDHNTKTGTYSSQRKQETKNFSWTGTMLDLLSMFYYARSQLIQPGDQFRVEYLDEKDHTVGSIAILCEQGEQLANGNQTLNFKQRGSNIDLTLRLTDNALRVPLYLTIDSFQISGWRLRAIDIIAQLSSYRVARGASERVIIQIDSNKIDPCD